MSTPALAGPPGPPRSTLAAGDALLAVDLRGGGMRRLVVGEWDVLDGYPAGAVTEGRGASCSLPWPNRVRNGRWTWRGRDLQLDMRSREQPNALHGLVACQQWSRARRGAGRSHRRDHPRAAHRVPVPAGRGGRLRADARPRSR